ncbi:MAG: hypothetical protein AAFM92_12080 [Pseudomonadota bacterium]
MAVSMMSHALRMLWANLGNAARVSVVPLLLMYLAIIVVGGGGFLAIGGAGMFDPSAQAASPGAGVGFGAVLLGLVVFGIAIVFMSWVAISWHRFVLLEEYPQSWMPPFRGEEIRSYVGKLILLSFVYFLIALLPIFIVGMVASGAGEGAGVILGAAALLVLVPVFLWISFRLSSVLPAAAVAKEMGIGEAWRETQSHSGTIFWFGLCYVAVVIGIQIVVAFLGLIPILGFLISIAGSWFVTILGFSALTTVYGVAVEGRELT